MLYIIFSALYLCLSEAIMIEKDKILYFMRSTYEVKRKFARAWRCVVKQRGNQWSTS